VAKLGTNFLKKKDAKSNSRGLLFMATAELINPINKQARLTLMRAERADVDASLE